MLFSEPDLFSDQDPFTRAQGVLCWADLGSAPLRPSRTTTQPRLGASEPPGSLRITAERDSEEGESMFRGQSNSPIALTLQMEKLRPRKEMDFSGVT